MYRYHPKLLARLLHLGGFLVLSLTTLGLYGLAYRPLGVMQKQNETRIEQIRALLPHASAVQLEHRKLWSQLKEVQQSAAMTRQRIPAAPHPEEFIADIEGIAQALPLQIHEHRIGAIHELEHLHAMEIQLKCSGSYASICRFFAAIEQLARLTKISKFELSSAANSFGYPFHVTFVLYYAPPSNDTSDLRSAP